MIDVYDSEVREIEKVLKLLQERLQGKSRNFPAAEKEIKERFAEIGFIASVNWYEYAVGEEKQDGAMPEISITGRIEKREFDHDRQVHEVTNDVLELGEGGTIKTDPETVRKFLEGHKKHSHED
jgi:hypothetical protein